MAPDVELSTSITIGAGPRDASRVDVPETAGRRNVKTRAKCALTAAGSEIAYPMVRPTPLMGSHVTHGSVDV